MTLPTFKFETHYNNDILPIVKDFVDNVYGIFYYKRNAQYGYADYIDNKGIDRMVSKNDLLYHIKSVVYLLLNSDKAYCEFNYATFPFIISYRKSRELDKDVDFGGMWYKITDFNIELADECKNFKPYIYYKKR